MNQTQSHQIDKTAPLRVALFRSARTSKGYPTSKGDRQTPKEASRKATVRRGGSYSLSHKQSDRPTGLLSRFGRGLIILSDRASLTDMENQGRKRG